MSNTADNNNNAYWQYLQQLQGAITASTATGNGYATASFAKPKAEFLSVEEFEFTRLEALAKLLEDNSTRIERGTRKPWFREERPYYFIKVPKTHLAPTRQEMLDLVQPYLEGNWKIKSIKYRDKDAYWYYDLEPIRED